MKTATAFFSALLFSFLLMSCAAVTKHGPVKTETRSLAAFTKIHAQNAIDIDFTPGATSSVNVEAPDDLLKDIVTEVNNGTLTISLSRGLHNVDQPVKVHLQGTSLESADLEGACNLDLLSAVNGNSFRLELSGASSFRGTLYMKEITASLSGASEAEINGITNKFVADASGASQLKAAQLSSAVTIVKAEGASEASLQADSSLDAEASGASSVSYKGNPSRMQKNSSGASDIHKAK